MQSLRAVLVAGCQEGTGWTRTCPSSSSQGWAKRGSGVTGKGDSGRRPLKATKVVHGVSPSPAARGTASSRLLPPSQHPRQRRTLSALVSPGRQGGPGPFPSPGQSPGNKSLWDGEASPGQGYLFSPGGGGGGRGNRISKCFTLCESFKAPPVPPAWLQLQQGPHMSPVRALGPLRPAWPLPCGSPGGKKREDEEGKKASTARRREQIAAGAFPQLSPSLGGEDKDAPAPGTNCWAESELGNSCVSPHFSPFSQLHWGWVGVFFEGWLSWGWTKPSAWPLTSLAAPGAEPRACRSPWRDRRRLADAGRAKPIPPRPAQAPPGKCHQHWEGSGRLRSSPSCFCRSPCHIHHPKLGTLLHRETLGASSPSCDTSLCSRDCSIHEVS